MNFEKLRILLILAFLLVSLVPLAHDAKKVIVCNFDAKPGYSGVENTLYENPKTIMLLDDAATTANDLIGALKV